MKYDSQKKEITLNRKINELDKFVVDFISLLDKYVIVSGYVSILTGRSRSTEDVDLLIPVMTKTEFEKTWNRLIVNGFECINTSKISEAYDYLKEHAIRFCRNGKPIPNMEYKIMKNDIDKYSYDNKIKVNMVGKVLFISPLEMQIAYKLFLGSEKDIEDAKHLYVLFKEGIDNKELEKLADQLKVKDKIKLIK